jgi:mannitol/fructose-specific phosphotransferase system IIA component (Ntr-type)
MEQRELRRYFREELFVPNMKAKTKDESLIELADRFVEAQFIKNRDILLGMLRQRERLGTTAIGKGVAIPHGRTTAASEVMIAFGHSHEGIDFDAVDHKPVHLIFMVLAPPIEEDNRYLPILGKLVETLNDAAKREQLKKVTTFQEFLEVFDDDGPAS